LRTSSVLNRKTEAVDPVAGNKRFQLVRVRCDDANVETIAPLTFVERLKRLGKVPACIESKDVDAGTACGDGMNNCLVFQTKARRERHAARDCIRDLMQAILKPVDCGKPPIERRHTAHGSSCWALGAIGPSRSTLRARHLGGAALV
jgi:hypothetical protein